MINRLSVGAGFHPTTDLVNPVPRYNAPTNVFQSSVVDGGASMALLAPNQIFFTYISMTKIKELVCNNIYYITIVIYKKNPGLLENIYFLSGD